RIHDRSLRATEQCLRRDCRFQILLVKAPDLPLSTLCRLAPNAELFIIQVSGEVRQGRLCYTFCLHEFSMATIAYLECSKCGHRLPADVAQSLCPKDGGVLYVRYDLQSIKKKFT